MVEILPSCGSGRCIVRREPEAVMICCSLVPANWPKTVCVMAVGGGMESEYMNMDDVVAMMGEVSSDCRVLTFGNAMSSL